ncbi:hypothetical protein [Actinophytocola xanthii]|uniref:PPE family domain-containing protein n=1 Tax=Actinophytocola xanthii TaxID=1912961 RepID=A0A1Q8C0N1_9PSEU|nr:hypothetical protein [Actinophytocola xanthii]OLF07933.1 hypothetical protein BU204_34995 [Actinophytocola xanthii]
MAGGDEQYSTREYAGDRAADTVRVMQRMPDEDRSTRSQVQHSIADSQASELAPGVRMGDDRAIGDTPNWNAFSSQQLYDFATGDNVPTSADTLGRSFNDGGNRLVEAANGLFEAVTAIEGAWTGVAADSAKGALSPLAQAAGQAGQTAQMMGVQMARQSAAASEVRKLPPPQEFDQQKSLQAMITGGPAALQADMRAQKEAADAVKREQITYLDAYTQTLASVDAQTPSFVPPPTGSINPGAGGSARISGSDVAVPQSGGQFSTAAYSGGSGGSHTAAVPTGGSSGGGNLTPTGFDTGGFGPGGSGSGNVGTSGSVSDIPTSTSTSGFAPSSASVGPQPPVGLGTGGPGGGTPGGPAAGPGGFGGPLGAFGAGAGSGGFGQGGPASGSGSGSSAGAGPRGGLGAPGAGTAPTGAMVGRGGVGGAAPVGAGGRRAEDEDDDERDRPYFLIEGDPDSAFGSDQMTAPAVIGEAADDGDD